MDKQIHNKLVTSKRVSGKKKGHFSSCGEVSGENGGQRIYPARGCSQLQNLRYSSPIRKRSPHAEKGCSPKPPNCSDKGYNVCRSEQKVSLQEGMSGETLRGEVVRLCKALYGLSSTTTKKDVINDLVVFFSATGAY